jgi:hypothetical protein
VAQFNIQYATIRVPILRNSFGMFQVYPDCQLFPAKPFKITSNLLADDAVTSLVFDLQLSARASKAFASISYQESMDNSMQQQLNIVEHSLIPVLYFRHFPEHDSRCVRISAAGGGSPGIDRHACVLASISFVLISAFIYPSD